MVGIHLYRLFVGISLPFFSQRIIPAPPMEDPRTQFPLMHVPSVDPTPLADLILQIPQLRLVLLNSGY